MSHERVDNMTIFVCLHVASNNRTHEDEPNKRQTMTSRGNCLSVKSTIDEFIYSPLLGFSGNFWVRQTSDVLEYLSQETPNVKLNKE